MIEKPTMIPINDYITKQMETFLTAFNEVISKELLELEKDMENIKNVIEHSRMV